MKKIPKKSYIGVNGVAYIIKCPVMSVRLYAAEGVYSGQVWTFDSFHSANWQLKLNSRVVGKCYDKHDFRVEWINNMTYHGRFDLESRFNIGFNLERQIYEVLDLDDLDIRHYLSTIPEPTPAPDDYEPVADLRSGRVDFQKLAWDAWS
jgi:hypothetical protein